MSNPHEGPLKDHKPPTPPPQTGNAKQWNKTNDLKEVRSMETPIHPFLDLDLNNYKHNVKNIPPYVLDTLLLVHYKEQLNNTNPNVIPVNAWFNPNRRDLANFGKTGKNHHSSQPPTLGAFAHIKEDHEFNLATQDDYTNRLGNNWHNLVRSVVDPQAYVDTTVQPVANDANWYEDWGGDTRLRQALLGEDDALADTETTKVGGGWRLFKLSNDEGQYKSKTLAKYWLLDVNRKTWGDTLNRIVLYNNWLPLILRLLLIICCACALGMACTIYQKTHHHSGVLEQQPLTIMAICVQLIAMAYLFYIAYDEFTGKPLGLRSPNEKLKYILLDMLFIILLLANLALAFNTLYDSQWVCEGDPGHGISNLICRRQRAVAAFLFLVVIFWVVGFILSTTRIIARFSNNDRR